MNSPGCHCSREDSATRNAFARPSANTSPDPCHFTGVTTEVCVQTTSREANDRGYECLILEDCVGSYFPEFQRVALEMIKAQGGIVGWVSNSAKLFKAIGR